MIFLVILVVLKLDLDQISFNLVENALATPQLALLATRNVFYHILARACAEIDVHFAFSHRSIEVLLK